MQFLLVGIAGEVTRRLLDAAAADDFSRQHLANFVWALATLEYDAGASAAVCVLWVVGSLGVRRQREWTAPGQLCVRVLAHWRASGGWVWELGPICYLCEGGCSQAALLSWHPCCRVLLLPAISSASTCCSP